MALTIDSCREMAPKKMEREAVKHFNTIMSNIADMPMGARDALRDYLFIRDPNADYSIADKCAQFGMDIATGQVCLKCAKLHAYFCVSYVS